MICFLIVIHSADDVGFGLMDEYLSLEGLILGFLQVSVFHRCHEHDIG